MNENSELHELRFTVSGRIARSCAEVYEVVANPEQLSKYFTTGGARGRLESGVEVSWDFHDFPGAFPVTVVEATPPNRIVLRWDGEATVAGQNGAESNQTTVTFEFQPIDDDSRTLVTISEAAWQVTPTGAKNAFGNCEGWTGMLAAMKVWLEHGINLREGFYA